MDDAREDRLYDLMMALMELSPEDAEAYILAQCPNDPALRTEVLQRVRDLSQPDDKRAAVPPLAVGRGAAPDAFAGTVIESPSRVDDALLSRENRILDLQRRLADVPADEWAGFLERLCSDDPRHWSRTCWRVNGRPTGGTFPDCHDSSLERHQDQSRWCAGVTLHDRYRIVRAVGEVGWGQCMKPSICV